MNCSGNNSLPEILGGSRRHLLHGVIDVVIVTIIISCNSLITVAIIRYNWRRKNKGLSSPPNTASLRLVLSLAITDILASFTTIYFLSFDYSCAVYTTLGAQELPCVARFALFMFAAVTSNSLLVALAIDRYVAVVHPLRYRDIMTKRVAHCLIALMWLIGAFAGFSLFFWNNWTRLSPCQEFLIIPGKYIPCMVMLHFVVAATVLLGLHCGIHREALASMDFFRSMNLSILKPSQTGPMKVKSARNIYLVVVCVVLMWAPLPATVIVRGQGVQSPYLETAFRLSLSIYNLGYFINTFIYSWKNATIKTAVLEMLQCNEKRRDSSRSSVMRIT